MSISKVNRMLFRAADRLPSKYKKPPVQLIFESKLDILEFGKLEVALSKLTNITSSNLTIDGLTIFSCDQRVLNPIHEIIMIIQGINSDLLVESKKIISNGYGYTPECVNFIICKNQLMYVDHFVQISIEQQKNSTLIPIELYEFSQTIILDDDIEILNTWFVDILKCKLSVEHNSCSTIYINPLLVFTKVYPEFLKWFSARGCPLSPSLNKIKVSKLKNKNPDYSAQGSPIIKEDFKIKYKCCFHIFKCYKF
jgi:hypothetical protein